VSLLTAEQEAQLVDSAASCGEQMLDALSERQTGRAVDLADLAFAYHMARAQLLRDTQVTDEEKLTTIRIVDAVADRAGLRAEELLRACGRLKESDA